MGGNALRAVVLGTNDGLVTSRSLVMGVAGASDGQCGVLLEVWPVCWSLLCRWPWASGFR
ncbi:VIT1/CCC1 transporter family protein [Pontibacter russatus]|uniref:VIT1/CCC1 transporter family protein n=1 Tax=Pontibacter russatus TaxID=2694929 RepID=UPI003742AECF